jgi:hypothetical protein
MKRRSYFSRILPPPPGTTALQAPRSPFVRPSEAGVTRSLPAAPLRQPVPTMIERLSVRWPFVDRMANVDPPEGKEQSGPQATHGMPRKARTGAESAVGLRDAPSGGRPMEAVSAPFERAAAQEQFTESVSLNQRESREIKTEAQKTGPVTRVEHSKPRREPLGEIPARGSSATTTGNPRPTPPLPGPSPGFLGFQDQPQLPPRPAPVPQVGTPQADRRSGNRVEIGSLEVRLIPPPQPPKIAVPTKRSGPIARPVPLPFGLRQI